MADSGPSMLTMSSMLGVNLVRLDVRSRDKKRLARIAASQPRSPQAMLTVILDEWLIRHDLDPDTLKPMTPAAATAER